MPNEQRKVQDDFIVVGGKRRWFSIPGNDQRIDDLQQRIKQERSLVIPDRPSETAWITVNVELEVFDHQYLTYAQMPVNWAHSSVWYRISWRLQWQSCISCWKSIVAKHGNWQLTAGTSHVFMASTSLIVQPFTSFTEYQSLVSKSAINNQRGTGPLAMKKRKVVETNGRTSVMKSFLDGQTASSPQLFIAWIDFQRRIIPWTVIANILPCQFNEANKSHFCSH